MGDSGLSSEDFEDYMSGGVRYRRPVLKRPSMKRVALQRPSAKRVTPKRPSAKRPSVDRMARFLGGFFEELEGFTNDKKEEEKKSGTATSTKESSATEEYMEPLKRGGAKKRVVKKGLKKGLTKGLKKGGYEQDQEEDFTSLSSAVSQATALLSGGAIYRRPRPRPVNRAPSKVAPSKRGAVKRPARRSASPVRRH
jgi:hypothetical protein